jgi:hypothetical protein
MMGLVCQFDPRQHYVLRGCVARAIGRVVPKRVRDHLFLYRHKVYGNYVVAKWEKKGRLFEDVLNLGPRLPMGYKVGRDVARMFEWNPVPLWKELREQAYQREKKRTDEGMTMGEKMFWKAEKQRKSTIAI